MNTIYQPNENEDKLDDLLKPTIYYKNAIWGFSVFFTPLFGGILLMQNLKEIKKNKEANIVLFTSLALTILVFAVVIFLETKGRAVPFLCNMGGAALLSEYFFVKYFPNENAYPKKKTWKPLLIGLAIFAIFIILILISFFVQDSLAA